MRRVVDRGLDADDHRIRVGHRVVVRRRLEKPGGGAFSNKLGESGLIPLEGGCARTDPLDFAGIDVDADDADPLRRENGGHGYPDVSKADDGNLHVSPR